MALFELRVVLFKQANLLLGEGEALGSGFLLQCQEPLVAGFEVVANPDVS